MTNRIYVIADIHGQLDALNRAHRLIAQDRARVGDHKAEIVHLGDLTDRGPKSRGVLDYLMDGQNRRAPWVVIKGNHDRLFTRFMEDPDWYDPAIKSGLHWLDPRLGGATTLASYGVADATEAKRADAHAQALTCVPVRHLDWLDALPLTYEFGDLFFVHAGVRPGVALADQVENDLVWIRADFIHDARDHGALIVHGHTSIDQPKHHGNRVNLDGGAGHGRALIPAVFEGRDVWTLHEDGRVPLVV